MATPETPIVPFKASEPEKKVARSQAIAKEGEGLGKSYRDLYSKKEDFVLARGREIWEASGQTADPDAAMSRASKEFDDEFLIPLTSQYTETFGEAAFNIIGPNPKPAPIMQLPVPKDEFGVSEEPSILTAIRPQTYYSPLAAEALKPTADYKLSIPQEIDFDEVAKTIQEKEKLDKNGARLQAYAIRAAYLKTKEINPKLQPEDAYSKTIEELQGLEKTMSGKGATISGGGMTGPSEPLYRAFVGQKVAGQVPDVSTPQMAYFDYIYKDSQKKIREEETTKIKKTGIPYVKLSDGSEYPADIWQAMKGGGMPADIAAIADSEESFIKEGGKIEPAELEGRVNKRLVEEAPEIWWADPEKKPAVLTNPEEYYKTGVLSTDTPFGGTIETPAGWLFRSALTVPNLFAGWAYENIVSPAIESADFGTGLGEKRAASRETKTPIYKDSPVLLNVAEGRGFTGEQMDAGELLGMGTGGRIAMTAAGFALDLLDPTLGMAAGAVKGTRGTVQSYKLSRALYAEGAMSSVLRAAEVGAKAGATEFINDFNIVSLGAKGVGTGLEKAGLKGAVGKARSLAVGDIRTHMGADLTASLVARDTVREGILAGKTAEEIIDDLIPFAKTTYAKSYSEALNRSGGRAVEAFDNTEYLQKAARKVEGTTISSRLLHEHDASMKSLDNIVSGNISAEATKGIRTKDLARNLGAMAKFDPAYAGIFKAVDGSPKAGVPKIYQYVEALGPDGMSALKRQFAYDKALTSVYRSSPEMAGLENMISITKNTWADKDQAGKILDRVKNSEIGRAAKIIIDNNVRIDFEDVTTGLSTRSTITGTTGPTAGRPTLGAPVVTPYYNIGAIVDDAVKADLTNTLSAIIEEQVNYGKIKSNSAGRMRTNLSSGKITTKDFRTLLEGATDLTAEGMFAGGTSGARARDLARTSSAQQLSALEPLEFRSFGRNIAKQWYVNNLGEGRKVAIRGRVSVQQRRLIKEVEQKASAMDIELRRRMAALQGKGGKLASALAGAMMGGSAAGAPGAVAGAAGFALASKLKGGMRTSAAPSVRALYGLDPAGAYTNYELLGALIVGPKRTAVQSGAIIGGAPNYALKQEEIIAETMRWTIRRLFFKQKTAESILDQFTGLREIFQNDILSKAGEVELDGIIAARTKAAMANPATYWDEINGLVIDMRKIISKEGNLQIGIREGDITQVVKAGATGNAAKIPSEVQIGSFYTAESERIMEEAVAKLIDEDETLGNLKLADGLDKVFADAQKDWLMQTTGARPENVNEIYIELVKDRAVRSASTRNGLASIDETGFADFIDSFNAQGGINISSGLGKELDELAKALRNGDKAAADIIFARNKGSIIYLSELGKSVDDAASTIIRRNGLETNGIGDASRLTKEIEAMFSGGKEETMLKALLGEDVYSEIKSAVLSGKMNGFDQYIDASIRKATSIQGAARKIDAIKQVARDFNSLRFTLLLALRPRFHGPNVIMANAISYSTLGKFTGNPIKAIQTVTKGSDWGSAGYYQLAGYFGRQKTPYTYGEIYEAIVSSGVRSQSGFVTQVSNQSSIVDFLKRADMNVASRTFGDAVETLQDLTTSEDLMFRTGIALDGLNQGRTLDEAVELARRSLFDYGDMTAAEKTASSYALIFYSFTRQNFITLLRAAGDVDKLKRYERILKTDRGIEGLAQSASGERFNKGAFFPDYTLPRTILAKIPSRDADYYIVGAPIPGEDAILLAANIASGNFGEILTKQLNPTWSYALDLDTVNRSYEAIQPEHVWYSSSLTDSPAAVASFWQNIAGGEITPVYAPEAKGAVNGYIYPLNTEQKANYAAFVKWALSFSGLGAPTQDFARAVGGEGMSTQELSPTGQIAFGVGAITPMKVKRPEAQERSQIYKRLEEIDKEMSRIKSAAKTTDQEKRIDALRQYMLDQERARLGIK
jgi:hypothetical protein